MRRVALGFALVAAVVLPLWSARAAAMTRPGHGAVVVASRGAVVAVPRSSVVVSRSAVVVSRSAVVVPRSSVVVVSRSGSAVVVVRRSPFVIGSRVFVGARAFVGPVWWGPGFYPYPYPVAYAPPLAAQEQAPAYAPPTSTPHYWYYCRDSKEYYPYRQQCPSGWLQVVPSPPPPPGSP